MAKKKLPAEYTLTTIVDVLSIDEAHIDEFLLDLKDYYDFFRPIKAQGLGTPTAEVKFKPDGKRAHTHTVRVKNV